jgi:LPPG:FO 2-phospho-L-lactate transferase
VDGDTTYSGESLRIVALAGGTGSAKLLRGLKHQTDDFTVISNVGDNFWHHGLYICPDIDIALYTLAGIADTAKGWGVQDDTFTALSQLRKIGEETWFNLGDKDLATHIFRTERLKRGERLGEITAALAARLGVEQAVLPCTDDSLETYIITDRGVMHLQEFWVKNRGEPEVRGVEYRGAGAARPEARVIRELGRADRIIFCPANPVTSILPILAVGGVREAIARSRARKVAVSPVIGGEPVSGPAGKMMRAIGADPTCASVAKLYSGLIDVMLIDPSDAPHGEQIQREGARAVPTSIFMKDLEGERRLARTALEE